MQLNDVLKYKILFYSEQGMKGREIARRMDLNPTTVNNLLKKHRENNTVAHKCSKGRLKSINTEVSNFIENEIDKNPKCSLRKMRSKIMETLGKSIIHVTIKRYLNSN